MERTWPNQDTTCHCCFYRRIEDISKMAEAMSDRNPAGTLFLDLMDQLIDVAKNPDASRIEVVMGSYELDAQGKKPLVDGEHSVAPRSVIVTVLDKDVLEQLRQQVDAGPLAYLMILWIEHSANEKRLGVLAFDPVTSQTRVGIAGLDKAQQSAVSDYLQRQAQRDGG